MRPLRNALLGALLTSVTVVGGVTLAPAASAAATALEWETDSWDDRTKPWQNVYVCPPAGDSFEVGQTITSQVLVGGTWGGDRSVTVDEGMYCARFRADELVPGPGTWSLRARTRTSPGAPFLEATTSLRVVGERSSVHASDEQFYFHTAARIKPVRAEISVARGQQVELQRRSGTRWVTVSHAVAPKRDGQQQVDLRVPTRAGNATYRLVNRATPWSTRSVSKPFLVHQTDSARHGRYIAQARKLIARYCPRTPIFVDIPEVQGSGPYGTIGLAWGTWPSIPARGGELRTALALRSGLTGKSLQHTALHECAHVVQFRAAVEDKHVLEEDRAWRLWPRVGNEGQADCMAHHFSRRERMYYVPEGCSPRQMDSARRMWRTYGPKYQAAVHRWGPWPGHASMASVPDGDAPTTTVVSG